MILKCIVVCPQILPCSRLGLGMQDQYLMYIAYPDPEMKLLLLLFVDIESNENKGTDNVIKSIDDKTGGES